jgi:hypothetical protein
MIQFTCPECNATLRAIDERAGTRFKCGKCGNPVKVPAAAAPQAPATAPAPKPKVAHVAATPAPERAQRPSSYEMDEADMDDRPNRKRIRAVGSGGGAAHSLGIGAMVLGVVGLLLGLIPCVGWIGLPLSGLGLLLGLVGSGVALARGGQGIGFPVAGSAISGLALLIGGFWVMLVFGAAKAVDDADKKTTVNAPMTGAPPVSTKPVIPAPATPPPVFIGVWRAQNGLEMVFREDGVQEYVSKGELNKGYWKVRDANHIEFRGDKDETRDQKRLVLEYRMGDNDTMWISLGVGDTPFAAMYRVKQP